MTRMGRGGYFFADCAVRARSSVRQLWITTVCDSPPLSFSIRNSLPSRETSQVAWIKFEA